MKRAGLPLLLLLAAVAGCSSALAPFPTAPRGLSIGEKDPGPRVSVCYNKFKTEPDQVQRLAQAQCPSGTTAELFDTDYRLDDCPLLTPGRATFLCKSAK